MKTTINFTAMQDQRFTAAVAFAPMNINAPRQHDVKPQTALLENHKS